MKTWLLSSALVFLLLHATAQYYPPPACIHYDNGVLRVCPPDSIPSYSGGLLGYNLYQDGQYLIYIPASGPGDTLEYIFNPVPDPGPINFCAKAVYQNWISDEVCDSLMNRYGYELPFEEDWSSGTFEENNWTVDGNTWTISTETGDPGPSAKFRGSSGLQDYSSKLTSYPFLGDSIFIGSLYLDFDLKLNSLNATGNEKLYYQVWDWISQQWYDPVIITSNANGSLDWHHYSFYLFYKEEIIKIRFIAEGQNFSDIEGWYIDNVLIYRECFPPDDLTTIITNGKVVLNWLIPSCGNYPPPLSWNWSNNYDYIGTGFEAEFDVAARWLPSQLENYINKKISSISFYPGEANATYSIRIWEGDSAELVYDQVVNDPIIHTGNNIPLDSLYTIQADRMLWIGYHVQTMTGFPAGVDEGPADDGYGNMMYWDGHWITLLEMSNDLNYNWWIAAHIFYPAPYYCGSRIYRSINGGEYSLIEDMPMDWDYVDEEADPADLNCYLVTNVIAKLGDTCESGYSNESCITTTNVPIQDDIHYEFLHPNPAKDFVTVDLSSIKKNDNIFISLYDILGTETKRFFLPKKQDALKLDISDIPSGLYFVSVNEEGKVVSTAKLMIIR